MKSIFTAVGVLALLGAVSLPLEAQTVDFSGTWTLDRDASEFPQFPGGGGGGGGRGGGGRGGGGRVMPGSVEITQDGQQLVMNRQAGDRSQTVTYLLDGSESTSESGRGSLTSTSMWDGTTLVTEGAQSISTPRGDFDIDLVERLSLSDDGQTMTVESLRNTPRGEFEVTLVYRREG